jgi:hypothetical protein
MLANSVAALMIASILTAQTPAPDPQIAGSSSLSTTDPSGQNAPAATAQAPVATAAAPSITLPAGTAIPLTLMTVIKSKSTKPGDSVRAVVAFPVTEGTQLAIPAGTYVEGVVNKVTAKPLSNQAPMLRVHFTRLVFTNGYSAPVSGENTQALLPAPEPSAPANEVAELAPLQLPGARFAMGGAQEPPPTQPPTLPRVGPPMGEVIGISLGATAAALVTLLVWGHHRANSYDFAVFDVGWQFSMVLDSPVTLDAAQVAAAAAMTPPSAN